MRGHVRILLACFAMLSVAPNAVSAQNKRGPEKIGTLVPLGIEMTNVEPSNTPLNLLVAAISPEFETWSRVIEDNRKIVYSANGARVERFPKQLKFRVTASTRALRNFAVNPGYPVRAEGEMNDFLLKLAFKLRVFRALESRAFEPTAVELIGMPADVQYDERVWIVTFEADDVLLSDRVFLDLLTPDGSRISKFYLEF